MRLLKESGSVGIRDYLTALKYKISRQQALVDLREIEGVRRIGKGRGARWKIAA